MRYLETQAFPVHPNTVEGVLTDQNVSNLPYRIVHANADGTLTATYNDGRSVSVTLTQGEDVVLVGDVATITTTGAVKAS